MSAAKWGVRVEEAAAARFDLRRVHFEAHDAQHKSNGSPVQIKAARATLASGRSGRFRFWKDDHDQLVAGRGSYILGVYDPDRGILAMRKATTAEVERAANWGPSGHASKGRQAKVAWPRLIPEGDVTG